MPDERRVVLVVDDDASTRGLLRTLLELEGIVVVEATSVAEAERFLDHPLSGVVLAGHLADGEESGVHDRLRQQVPVRIVLHGGDLHAGAASASRRELDEMLAALDTPPDLFRPRRSGDDALTHRLVEEWTELCRWDPELPHDSRPPAAERVVEAVSQAMQRPQPLGWGLDPAVERVSEEFARSSESADVAVAQLVCLREAFERLVMEQLPAAARTETSRRLTMILGRLMTDATRTATAQLKALAATDQLTGLLNRRIFEFDLERERSRAERHGRALSLAVFDLDGLKQVNDTEGHAAGDRCLRAFADALRTTMRLEDTAYRLGGDEFALLLPDTTRDDARTVVRRLAEAKPPAFSVGIAGRPDDDVGRLPEVADRRLYEGRRARPGHAPAAS